MADPSPQVAEHESVSRSVVDRQSPSRSDRLTPAALAVLSGALFASTHSAAIQVADSGELVAAACNLGVAHPPGYPLYTLLGHLACKLPFSTAAGRVGLVSVLAGVLAVLAMYGIVRRLTKSRWAGVTAALVLATGSLFWRHASLAEVFVLNVALSLGVVYAVVRSTSSLSARWRWRWLIVGCALFGLALSNHLSAALLGPLLLVALVSPWAGLPRVAGMAVLCLLAFGLGLTPYAQLVLADPFALPRWGDTSTWDGLVHHLLRRDYGTLQLAIGGKAGPLAAPWAFVVELPRQLGWLLSPLALWGAVLVGSRASGRPLSRLAPDRLRRDLAAVLLAAPLLCGPLFLLLFNIEPVGIGRQVVERFFVLPVALAVIWLGVGLAWLESALRRRLGEGRARLWGGVVLAAVGVAALSSYVRADVSDTWAAEDYAQNALAGAEKNAMIVGLGDVKLFSMLHAQRVRGQRKDVQYVDARMLLYRWYVEQQRQRYPGFAYRFTPRRVDSLRLIQGALRRGRPVYLTGYYNSRVRTAFASYPAGPLLRIVDIGRRPPSLPEVIELNRRLFRGFRRRGKAPDPRVDPWSASLREPFAATWRAIAHQVQRRGRRTLALRLMRLGSAWAPWMPRPRWMQQKRGVQQMR
jgi:hypothetical protein